MNLSSSEMLPKDINELPPARQRHIRRQPRAASLAERQLLLESLISLTDPTLNFLLLSLLGAVSLAFTLYLNEPTLLILTLALFPFLRPIFCLTLLPSHLHINKGTKGLVSLSIILALTFFGGFLAGWIQKSTSLDQLGVFHFGYLYWLDLLVLCVGTSFGAFYLLRRGNIPRLIGMLLSYEILVPLAVAGFSFPVGAALLWPNALIISMIHLGISLLTAFGTFLLLGFSPKRTLGWSMIALPLTLTMACVVLSLNISGLLNLPRQSMTPTTSAKITTSPTPTAKIRQSSTATSTLITQTETPKQSQTLTTAPTTVPTSTLTPSIAPTSYWGVIEALTGVVIRESPVPDALVIDYANNGDEIEIIGEITSQDDVRWYQVITGSGKRGWLLASLVTFQTPVP
jgi:hypothetical protein